ncbi:serine/threonine protein kinase [Actinomadura sp. NBRC 104425]|uniref:serine/threonine-protein kinase n=1 Tax=Actinomadura sp. NBRC 104425 TaxID=3032204 RepID=UPI0024A177F5|nr:serine/threonine-protein kinase [Actinomadura sp. NBRC 104425]GLZ14145.1 serine/threonine protein kinase [Actinomadura sp. NBRC 104425]
MEALRAGDPRRIGGHRLLGRLGAGGMGQVFLGRSPGGTLVAVKLVHAHLAEDPDFRARFRREVGAARAVSGAFTAPVVDADPDADPPWLATAYLPGVPLDRAVPLPVPAVFALGAGLAEALVSIHRAGVVHRDLKPSNVILGLDGPRVIDFGIAHAADAAVVTRTGFAVGSPGFIAPEQARGGVTGPAADVFSLGAVLVFAATGVGPYGQGPPHVLIYRVVHERPRLDGVPDPALRAVVEACLEQDPARRPTPARLLEMLARHVPQSTDLHGVGWLPGTVAQRIAQAGSNIPDVPSMEEQTGPTRRRVLLLGGAAAAVALGAGGVATALVRSSRANPGPRPTLASASPATAASPAPMRDGKILWKRFTGSDYLSISPVVSGGRVFIGSEKEDLRAFDTRTGKHLWTYWTGRRINTPAVASGVVYALAQDGVLYAVDAKTGRLKWRRTVGRSYADIIVADGLVYAGDFYALDARTGSVRWQGRGGGRSPAIADGVIYVPGEKILTAYDAATGRTRWTYRSSKGVWSTAVADGLVCFGDFQGETVHAVDARTGKRRWTYDAGNSVTARPVVVDGVVYVGDYGEKFYALDAATGTMKWQVQTEGHIHDDPVLADGVLYVPSGVYSDGSVYALDAATGRKIWRFQAEEGIESSPAIADGTVYIGCKDGYLYALDARGGTGTATG